MDNKELTYQESLQLINTMIRKAKNSYHDTGIGAILWGVVIATCSLVRFSEQYFNYRLPFDIYLLTLVALIPQIFISLKERRNRKVKSYDDRYTNFVWLAFGISIFLLIHIINLAFAAWAPVFQDYKLLTGHVPAFSLREYIAPLFLILYGLPTFITGAACKFKPMLWGGLFCWACSIITVYTNYNTDLLLTALSAIVAWLIPGILMKKEYSEAKKNEAVANV